jgi:secondary thiamine-phosphate synthase enzyme
LKVLQQERRPRASVGLSVTDITDDVNAAVRDSGIRDGIACVYSAHTSCCVRVNELETGLLEDFAALLARLFPRETSRSRGLSMLLGSAGESIPVAGGELLLGRWQRVLFLQLDRAHDDAGWLLEVVGNRAS